MEFFFVILGVFWTCFHTTTNGYSIQNGSKKATNTVTMEKPNGTELDTIIIKIIRPLIGVITLIQARNSSILIVTICKVHQNFEGNSYLYMNNKQNLILKYYMV